MSSCGPCGPDVPILMTSGFVRQEDEETARRMGLQGLLLKPDTVEHLGAELDRVFRANRLAGEAGDDGVPHANAADHVDQARGA